MIQIVMHVDVDENEDEAHGIASDREYITQLRDEIAECTLWNR